MFLLDGCSVPWSAGHANCMSIGLMQTRFADSNEIVAHFSQAIILFLQLLIDLSSLILQFGQALPLI
jgi:hypothetical protein